MHKVMIHPLRAKEEPQKMNDLDKRSVVIPQISKIPFLIFQILLCYFICPFEKREKNINKRKVLCYVGVKVGRKTLRN